MNEIQLSDNRLAIYAERDIVRELAERLWLMHPNAKEVGKEAMFTVAQMAIMTGANPLPGKNGIHVWQDKKGGLIYQFGIGYWRSQADKAGGISWAVRPRIMSDQERRAYAIDDKEIGAICEGGLWPDVQKAMALYRANGEDIKLSEARKDIAVIGIGVVTKTDYPKNGRPVSWTALERCERDLLRKLVPDIASREDGDISNIGGVDWEIREFISGTSTASLPPVASIDGLNDFLGFTEGEYEEAADDSQEEAEEMTEPAAEAEEDAEEVNHLEAALTASTLKDFALSAAALMPQYYKNNFNIVGALKKDWPNKPFKYDKDLNSDYLDFLAKRKETKEEGEGEK